MVRTIVVVMGLLLPGLAWSHSVIQTKGDFTDKFRQLDEILPTPNDVRTASGAPGKAYWQQRIDYKIKATLDEDKRTIAGAETITYHNNSPDALAYLWVQLDQNRNTPESDAALSTPAKSSVKYTFDDIRAELTRPVFPGGHVIKAVKDGAGQPLAYAIHDTMMRIDLAAPVAPGGQTTIAIEWQFNIPDRAALKGRAGYEYFASDGNAIFLIGEWYPRLAAYTDSEGWQNKAYLGTGEFALDFGNFEVSITVPADHVVAATGVLQNPEEALTPGQRQRLAAARNAAAPVFIVTPEEAQAAEKARAARKKTWVFKAENVRDFAFASSRKFIWDAMGRAQQNGPLVMAMSFYPSEGMPLWDKYATEAIAHTLEIYSKYTFPYPYPVAQAVNGTGSGMEYPMISFNGPRPEKDGNGVVTYSRQTKYDLISVIIHEVGHYYFPMVVNPDERKWMWLDEGLNSFLGYLAEQAWEEKYPSKRGKPRDIAPHMTNPHQVPVMTDPESITNLNYTAYRKPATALYILREVVLGRAAFDYAFREFARRWMFKRPTPADFFRTMEDASAVDLDWFWRGWFYTTDHVDISLDNVRKARINSENPEIERAWEKAQEAKEPDSLSEIRDRGMKRRIDGKPGLKDFYNQNDEHQVTNQDRNDYQALLASLEPYERAILKQGGLFYLLDFTNRGGLVMPILLEIEYVDGSREEKTLPAEIWRRNPKHMTKLLPVKKEIRAIAVDPRWDTADSNRSNNYFPRRIDEIRLDVYRPKEERNQMRDAQVPLRPGAGGAR